MERCVVALAAASLLGCATPVTEGPEVSDLAEIGALIGDAAFSQAFETEADHAELCFAARAGYGANEPEKLWRRMSTLDPSQIRKGPSHPPNAARYLSLAATQRESAEKKEAGQPLLPRLKKDSPL